VIGLDPKTADKYYMLGLENAGDDMKITQLIKSGAVLAILLAVTSVPAAAQTASVVMKNAEGKEVGSVNLTQTTEGVLVNAALKGLPPGEHAFHVHAVGKCEPPFTSAGGHFNPGGKKHGMMSPEGQHAGDMPNLHIPQSGDLTVEVLNTGIALEKGKPNSVFDSDGSAIVVHAGSDDYKTDPTGEAGGRIACGVIQ